ncbi:hypothetical protein CF067_17020 [Clostridium sporogenes]|uniref:Uncharacterized protein n=1 Tax=Clostridium botulinum B str. Osaka05 TaxID=1407017 RepID=A0A060N5D9_CLOBO|nr:hypothetical protein [Clostridium botulinum]BAO05102.1 uncharacterized protein CBO05P2_077 [Clostridium botulinum B str. Osaka05]
MKKCYKGCIWLNKKKRKEKMGCSYAELQKMWRTANRENKLNKRVKITFKQWRTNLLNIIW